MQINSSPAWLCKKYSHFREFEAFLTFFWHFLAIFEQKMAFFGSDFRLSRTNFAFLAPRHGGAKKNDCWTASCLGGFVRKF